MLKRNKISDDSIKNKFWATEHRTALPVYWFIGLLLSRLWTDTCIFLNFIERPGNKQSSSIPLSIYSALSEDQSANFIMFWIAEFLKTYGRIPKVFVCDMSFALINAAVRTFDQLSNIVGYIDTLFHLLNHINDSMLEVPLCWVRIDLCHLMNPIKNSWNMAKNQRILHSMHSIMIQTKSLDFARNMIYSILIVAKSKTEGIYITKFRYYNVILLYLKIINYLYLVGAFRWPPP